MLVAPGVLFTVLGVAANVVLLLSLVSATEFIAKLVLVTFVESLWSGFVSFYVGTLLYGCLTVVSEWRRIKAKPWQKVIFLPAFPLFMFTYIPITVCALFQKVEWKPIAHKSTAQLDRAA